MPTFAARVPRLGVLAVLLIAFCIVTPETLARGADLCLWRRIFQLSACPACGTLRSLAAFFHGRLAEALKFNRNVLVTAPVLVVLLVFDGLQGLRNLTGRSGLKSQRR